MNNKFKKKKSVSKKSIIFYSFMGVVVLTLLAILVVKLAQTRDVNSYDRLEMITGPDLFNIEEDEYFVLVYNFNGEKEYETFDNSVFKYLTFERDNRKATSIYGMDIDENQNKPCIVGETDTQSVSSATQFPNRNNTGASGVLYIRETNLPMLLVITDGKVSAYKTGETEILNFIKEEMK